jgi:demethylmenaquinone methyltransferase/2-methoxy-6-polyprenyl-1,4-benzoquinol methylase
MTVDRVPAVGGKYHVMGDSPEARAARVNDLFAAVAPRYDLINDLQSLGLHRLWKRRLVQLAGIRPGDTALDVCCGTGDVAFALARAGADTTGIDFSAAMLEVARRRAGKETAGQRLRFLQGDALRLPFDDASFDRVTISYGLRNLADLQGGLRELRRVLKPGGRLLVLDFGKPDWAPWRWVYFQYLRWCVPVLGRLFCGDADTHGYILQSLRAYPGQRAVDALLGQEGFTGRSLHQLLGGMMAINVAVPPAAISGNQSFSDADPQQVG